MHHHWSLARRLFLAHLLFVVSMTFLVGTAFFVDARDHAYNQAGLRMHTISASIADNPSVLKAVQSANPTAELQPYAKALMRDADADFITIMAPDRTRWTHPNPAEIGKPYIGSVDKALAGESQTEVMAGTLGPSVRTIVPIKDSAGVVRAMVASGVTVRTVDILIGGRIPALLFIATALLLAGSLASWFLGRYLRLVTRGWGPEELGHLFAYYESVLHSVREGVVLIDNNRRVVMYNDQAAELLGLPPLKAGTPTPSQSVASLPLAPSLKELFGSGRSARDEIHLTQKRVLVLNQEEARPSATPPGPAPVMGTVATLRDQTELESLGSELQSVKTLSTALRAQTHEHANRLHTMVSLMELGRSTEALDYATRDLNLSQQLTDDMLNSVDEPVISALIMGKSAQANELGIELMVDASGELSGSGVSVHELVTIMGNLLDNAMDAVAQVDGERRIWLSLEAEEHCLRISVQDTGPGIPPDALEKVASYGYSSKTHQGFGRGLGLALVRQSVHRLGGTMTIERTHVTDIPKGAFIEVEIPLLEHSKESGL
ncbi:sensor histidine kinase [Pseudarthrobacter sp. J1738]|uniref:sensor histidine kinase n=1 Tax=unclassified Pseudarthrobacter TaxID=2647000 RepID=UPI003D2AE32E